LDNIARGEYGNRLPKSPHHMVFTWMVIEQKTRELRNDRTAGDEHGTPPIT